MDKNKRSICKNPFGYLVTVVRRKDFEKIYESGSDYYAGYHVYDI